MISMEDYRLRKSIEIEEMDLNVSAKDRQLFENILSKYLDKFDPENEKSISECVKIMPTYEVRNLYNELMQLEYEE